MVILLIFLFCIHAHLCILVLLWLFIINYFNFSIEHLSVSNMSLRFYALVTAHRGCLSFSVCSENTCFFQVGAVVGWCHGAWIWPKQWFKPCGQTTLSLLVVGLKLDLSLTPLRLGLDSISASLGPDLSWTRTMTVLTTTLKVIDKKEERIRWVW